MAKFIKLNETYLSKDSDWYQVKGQITEEDISDINLLPQKTILVIESTRGLKADIIEKISSSNIFFSVLGEFDYICKEKYREQNYIDWTMMSPLGLKEVIKYFEEIEDDISKEWTDTQKCMYLYNAIVTDFKYGNIGEISIKKGILENGLNGILYKKLTNNGFAVVFKEGLDRLGIKNLYQNKKDTHCWNVVELGGKLRGLEITWDCYNKGEDNICQYNYFGQNIDCYKKDNNALHAEIEHFSSNSNKVSDEEMNYDLESFTVSELLANYRVIASKISSRKSVFKSLFNDGDEDLKMLPLDTVMLKYQLQSRFEKNYIMLYKFLKSNNRLTDDKSTYLSYRENFDNDILSFEEKMKTFFTGKDIGIKSLENCEFHENGNYKTPYGSKFIVLGDVVTETGDKDFIDSMFRKLNKCLKEFFIAYMIELLNNTDNILNDYDKILKINCRKNSNLTIMETDLYTKLQTLVENKRFLFRSGTSREIVDQRLGKINDYFSSKNITKEEEQKKKDIEFLLNVFNNPSKTRQICEQYEGRMFLDEEWQRKCTDVDYMCQIFYILPKSNIKREYVQEALNNIFSEEYNQISSGIKR